MRIRPEVEPIKMFARAEDKKLQSEIDFFMMSKHGRGRSRRAIAHFAQQSLLECAHTSSAFTQFLLCICCRSIGFFNCRSCSWTCRCQLLLGVSSSLEGKEKKETFSGKQSRVPFDRRMCWVDGEWKRCVDIRQNICSRYTSNIKYNLS